MKNTYIELLKSTSNTKIAFLRDVKKTIKIDKRGRFNHFYLHLFDIKGIEMFILNLNKNNFYTLIPLITKYGKSEDPHIILSNQILVTAYSNPEIIYDFLEKQIEIVINDFEISNLNDFHYLIFKYKKIVIEI